MKTNDFSTYIQNGYTTKGAHLTLGAAMLDGVAEPSAPVNIALKTMNRHGLIAGATGTGKTKTIRVLSEQLSLAGVPVLMMDIKGDFSGIAKAGEAKDFIVERHQKLNIPYQTKAFPVELLSLSQQNGVRLRATVTEFGPVLFSRILELNETQSGVVAVVFKYCDDHQIPLVDLKDFKKVLQYATQEGKSEFENAYGRISSASTGSILRKVLELEQQDADLFFGERSFEIQDLMRTNPEGLGYVNILRLTDIQDKPKLFSTFMLSLLAEVYEQLPEIGDAEKPKLVLFIDEAHLLFNEASKTLLDQIETIVKLIRSKGVGIYFITQNPMDVPAGVLGQLGLKIQHALRAFTAKDRKAIKLTAENYPLSPFYKTEDLITQLGIGEALVTALNEKGAPTPLAACLLRAPMSRMDILSAEEINEINATSQLVTKYNEVIDRESAHEILGQKIANATANTPKTTTARTAKPEPSTGEIIGKSVTKVVTSPSFIRGAMNILMKFLK